MHHCPAIFNFINRESEAQRTTAVEFVFSLGRKRSFTDTTIAMITTLRIRGYHQRKLQYC